MTTRVLVPLAEGFEEIEAVTVVDILRRAGAEVNVAGVEGTERVKGRSNIAIIPDMTLDEALKEKYDLIVLPGGLPAAFTLRDDARVIGALKAAVSSGSKVAAICAAPVCLKRAGLLSGLDFTSHPSVVEHFSKEGYSQDRVVVGGSVLTSRAAGTAMEFAFALVKELYGEDKVREVNEGVLARI